MYALLVSFLAALLLGTAASAHNEFGYIRQEKYEGKDFLDSRHWWFSTGSDPTNGSVNYLSRHHAKHLGLAYAKGNTFVMAVSTKEFLLAESAIREALCPRMFVHRRIDDNVDSVRITSKKKFNGGLFILDAVAMPHGCGVWPSFWTAGPEWPRRGEIDIVEGINNQPRNRMTLHSGTTHPCTIHKGSLNHFTGRVLNSDCHSNATSDSGCSIMDASTHSFGHGFNSVGGGVFPCLWDKHKGIFMWHFARHHIPKDIRERKFLTPLRWGKPAGFWSASSCNIAANFNDHSMIFDMTICGNWAGSAYRHSGCPGTCREIVADASNFADAKWVINYVDVYQPLSS